MPGPAGVNPILSRAVSIYSAPGSAPSETASANTSGFRGLASFVSPVIGAGLDYMSQLQSQHEQESYNSREAAKARQFSAQQASAAQAFNRGEARWAAEWNSPAHQLQQFKAAGLSPGLMMGQMSPATAQAASASPGSTAQAASAAASSSSFGKAVDSAIQARAVESTAALQKTEAAKNTVEALAVEIDNLSLHQRNLAELDKALASGQLDRENAERVRLLRDQEYEQLVATVQNLQAHSHKLGVESKFIEDVQTPNVKADTNLKKSQKSLADSNKELVEAQTTTEKERPSYIRQETETSSSLSYYYSRQSAALALAYGVKQSKVDAVASWLDDNGLSRNYLGFALDFCDDMAQHVGSDLSHQSISTIFSWLDGGSWLSFIGSRKNTGDVISSHESIAEEQIESNERIAKGHDAASLERIDHYFDRAAAAHDVQHRSEIERYRGEFYLLNDANKKRVNERFNALKSQGYDDDVIGERVGWYTHLLYEQQSNFNKR